MLRISAFVKAYEQRPGDLTSLLGGGDAPWVRGPSHAERDTEKSTVVPVFY
ncbi:MAG: hypothetical protein ABSA67_11340 [Candidatus Brocadiia bacterium]